MKKIFLFAVAASSLLMTACSEKEDANNGWQDVNRVESIVEANYIDPDEFIGTIYPLSSLESSLLKTMRKAVDPLLNQMIEKQRKTLDALFSKEVGTDENGGRKWQLEQWSFTYRSKSAKGEDILLSGRVFFPNNTVAGIGHQVKSLTLETHGAGTKLAEEGNTINMLRAFYNSAMIIPDYQAVGVNMGVDAGAMVSSHARAIQLADCALAALQLMRQRGVTLAENGYTTSKGISQGAAVPIAFAKYYETEAPQWFRNQIKLRETISMEGPQDFVDLFNFYDTHMKYNATLGKAVAASLASLNSRQLGGYEPGQFMADVFHETIVDCNGEQMSYYDALSMYSFNLLDTEKDMPECRKLRDILAPDMLSYDGHLDTKSQKTKTFMRILQEQNNIYGWTPRLPIYFIHCPQDDASPYESSYSCYDKLSAHGKNTNVHWGDFVFPPLVGESLSLIPNAVHAVTSTLVNSVYMNLYEYVEDAPFRWEN